MTNLNLSRPRLARQEPLAPDDRATLAARLKHLDDRKRFIDEQEILLAKERIAVSQERDSIISRLLLDTNIRFDRAPRDVERHGR